MKPSRRFLGLCLCCLASVLPALAGDASFDRVVTVLSRHYHAKPMRGMGLLSLFSRPFTPSGVHGLSLAVFDDLEEPAEPGPSIEQGLTEAVAPGYTPFLRVASGPRHELTCVYLREDGKRFHLLLVNTEPGEAVVMGMRLDPEALRQWLDDPEGMSDSCTKRGQRN